MIDRKRICGVLVAVVGAWCFAACSAAEPEAPPSASDSQNKPNEPGSNDSDKGHAGIASFQDKAITSCWVTLDWCDTPWISPHPQATCHSTGCDCAYAKQVCASLVEENCGAVISYGNDCR